ncbi:MAG: mechanosensitive ion channel family protein [Phycisphaerales bacterium]|nr:mechanosensitive ion channel family protein [Phycisphaerales bacterium]
MPTFMNEGGSMCDMFTNVLATAVETASSSPILDWVDSIASDWMKQDFIGLEYWRWMVFIFAIAIGFIVDLVVRLTLRKVLRSITHAEHPDSDLKKILRQVPRPAGAAACGGVWLFLLPVVGLSGAANGIIEPIVNVYITIAAIWFGFRGTDLIAWVAAQKAEVSENKLDDLLVPLLRKTLKAVVIVFGLVYLADSMKIQLAPLIAGLGIGSLGFALAAKPTIENFFGSITVILDKPFMIGDWVVVDNVEGTVESVGMRSTRIRTFYDTVVTIPNSILITSKCNNYSKRRYRRWKQMISIAYDTPPEKITTFCEGIRELLRIHPYTRKDYYQVWLNEFAGSSLDVLVYVFWKAPDWPTELRERHRFMLDIIRLAGELGVEFAFPTRTLYLRNEDQWKNGAESIPAKRPAGWAEKAGQEGRDLVESFTSDDDWRAHIPPPYRFSGARDGGMGGEGGDGEG